MIYDHLSRIDTYRALSAHFDHAIAFLRSRDLSSMPTGRTEIDGDRVYAVVHDYETVVAGSSRWESHRRYIDLQLILHGEERMLVADTDALHGATAYDAAKDVTFYEAADRSHTLDLRKGEFAILYPHDGHRATIAVGAPIRLHKLVIKLMVG